MKYLIALLLGMTAGAALFVVALTYNPFVSTQGVSPLAVTDADVLVLSYSGVAAESIVFSNNGESRIDPYPAKVQQLWEASIRQTTAMATVLRDARNQTAGVGIKFSSLSEETHLLNGRAMINSVWYLYLPERGSLFVEQNENHWNYLRDIVIAAYRNSANSWRGSWHGTMTAGPGALGTSKVTGGTGQFAGNEMLGVESLSVLAWSTDNGPISTTGTLTIELPDSVDEVEE